MLRFLLALLLAASGATFASATTAASAPSAPAPAAVRVDIDWAAFLARQDLVWEDLPWQWNEGAFLGNGQLGVVAYATLADNRLDFHLGRADVTDHRKAPDRKTSRGAPGTEVMDVMYEFPRLDIGRLALRPAGKITGGTLRVDLWNAELTGTITTDRGELKLRAVILRDRMAHRIDVNSTERDAAGQPLAYTWEFRPGNPSSPRALVFPDRPQSKAYVTNPPPRLTRLGDVPVCVQSLLAGGDYATAWLDHRASPSAGTLYVSTANEVPAADRSAPLAVRTVQDARAQADADLAAHRAWWHAYYPKSFLSIPDARLESFYWIQLFKLACASRADGPPIDNLGPFYRTTQWPGLWWNLNVQLTYWPVYAGNHLDLGKNLITELDTNFNGLWANYANNQKIGDFAWVLHNYWLQYRYAGDWTTLRTGWMPKAKIVAADYLKRLKPDASGRLELPATESPEYEGFKTYQNSNYNLALLRWLLNSLLELDARSGLAPDPAAAEWRRVLAALVPFSTDENGLMIGSNQPLAKSHRHYSHILGLYPLFQLDPDSPADRDLVLKSVRHWHKIEGGKELAGYSYTGAAALYAALGLGDDALASLNYFLAGKLGFGAVLLPNTLYAETGGKNPVIETPLSAASATQELLFQSWGGKLRVFPAVPAAWTDAAFADLRGQGGFLVSAARVSGSTAWVSVRSETGEPCIVKVPDWTTITPELTGPASAKLTIAAPGEFRLVLGKGETAILRPPGSVATPLVRPLTATPAKQNPYGLKRGAHFPNRQLWPEVSVSPTSEN
jgi:hypothetical protein